MRVTRAAELVGLLACILVAGLRPGSAAAEEGAETSTPERRRATEIEAVVVYSRKIAESLMDVPVSVTAFDSWAIQDLGIENVRDLNGFVPNLRLPEPTGGFNAMVPCMRGLCESDPVISEDPFVGVYVDGVYVSKAIGSVFDVIDLEQVEVLRGPQGTLYGKNTMAGAINLVSRKPGTQHGARFDARVGNFGRRDLGLTVDLPLADTLAATLSVRSRRRDGLYQNLIAGDLEGEDSLAARAAFRWSPTESLDVDYQFYRAREDEGPNVAQTTFVNPNAFFLRSIVVPFGGVALGSLAHEERRDDGLAVAGPNRLRQYLYGHSLVMAYDIGAAGPFQDLTLKLVTGYRRMRGRLDAQVVEFPVPYFDQRNVVRYRSIQEELQLNGAALDGRLEFVAGLFYFHETGSHSVENSFGDRFLSSPPVPAALYRAMAGAHTLGDFGFETRDYAGYGEATLRIGNGLGLTGGVRYGVEEKDGSYTRIRVPALPESGSNAARPANEVLFTSAQLDDDIRSNFWAPRVTVSYDWTEDFMTYATYSRGFKSGAFNGRAGAPLAWGPTRDAVLDNYEGGMKAGIWDGRAQLAVTGFYDEIKDFQVTTVAGSTGTALVTSKANAAKARIWGAEIEGRVRPIEGLELSGGFGIADTRFTEFLSAVAQPDGSVVLVDVHQNRIFKYAPKYTWNAAARYTFPATGLGVLSLRTDVYGTSRNHFEIDDNPALLGEELSSDPYAVWNARLSLDDVHIGGWPGTLSVALFGNNLLDESYRTAGFTTIASLGVAVNAYGDPRTFGLEFSYRWGGRE